MKYLLLSLAVTNLAFSQDIDTYPNLTGADATTSDKIIVRDVDGTTGNKVKTMTLGQLVNVPALFSSVPDSTFSIAKTSGLQTALNDKVDNSQISTNGGVSKVISTDGQGNLIIGTAVTEASSMAGQPNANRLNITNGNLFLTDDKVMGWMASDNPSGGVYGTNPSGGKIFAAMRFDRSHDALYGEWNFDTNSRMCFYWNEGMQFGNANGGNHYMYLHSGSATSGTTARQSVPVMMNTMTWTGGTTILNRIGFQAAPLDLTGANPAIHFYKNMPLSPTAQNIASSTAVPIATIATDGVWSAGTAPTFSTIGAVSNVFTQACSKYKTVQSAKITLGTTNTLAFQNLEAGMRGVIYVCQDIAGSKTLNLPSSPTPATPSTWTAGLADISTGGSSITRLSWEYDGAYLYYTSVKGLTTPADADYSAYIAATGATDTDNLSAFITGLKSLGLWSTSVCWPLRSSQNHASGTVVQSLGGLGSFNGTIVGNAARNATGITFDGVDDRISIPNPAQSTALPGFSMFSVFDSDRTINRFIFGSFGNSSTGIGPSYFAGGSPTGGALATSAFYNLSLDGTGANTTSSVATNGNTGGAQSIAQSYSPALINVFVDGTNIGSPSPLRASVWNNASTWEMGVRNNAGAYGFHFVGSQAFHMFTTTALTIAQHTALRDLYKATLGADLSLP